MKLSLHIPEFTWAHGPAQLGEDLAAIARTAEDAGFSSISVMDHFFQIGAIGPSEQEMLEAYTTLSYLAAHTSRVNLFAMVTGVVYRYPGVLAKEVTTLDVLSVGRAWLGIGAAWNEEESRGLGIPFPPVAERFERLEETLQICLQMWAGDEKPFDLGRRGEKIGEIVDRLGAVGEHGITTVAGWVPDVATLTPLEKIGTDLIPAIADL